MIRGLFRDDFAQIPSANFQDMQEVVSAAQERYVKSNPTSQKAFNEAAKHLPGGNTRSTLFADPFRAQAS
jgi:hypothetical protein